MVANMDRSNKLQSRRFYALLLILLVTTGCQNLQIPRIDPSGQSVFMPAPNYTTPEISCLQQPAFVTPEQAPPCDALPATRAAFTLDETPVHPITPAPEFGHHNDYVLRDLLALAPESIQRLRDTRIVTDEPIPNE